jgi:hypothetical protein
VELCLKLGTCGEFFQTLNGRLGRSGGSQHVFFFWKALRSV